MIGCKSSQFFDKSELTEEKLNNSLTISFPKNYKGQGYWKGEDTWGFKKQAKTVKYPFSHNKAEVA